MKGVFSSSVSLADGGSKTVAFDVTSSALGASSKRTYSITLSRAAAGDAAAARRPPRRCPPSLRRPAAARPAATHRSPWRCDALSSLTPPPPAAACPPRPPLCPQGRLASLSLSADSGWPLALLPPNAAGTAPADSDASGFAAFTMAYFAFAPAGAKNVTLTAAAANRATTTPAPVVGVRCADGGAIATVDAAGAATCEVAPGATTDISVGVLSSGAFVAGKTYKVSVVVPRGLAAGARIDGVAVRHKSRKPSSGDGFFATYTPHMHTLQASGAHVRPNPPPARAASPPSPRAPSRRAGVSLTRPPRPDPAPPCAALRKLEGTAAAVFRGNTSTYVVYLDEFADMSALEFDVSWTDTDIKAVWLSRVRPPRAACLLLRGRRERQTAGLTRLRPAAAGSTA